MVEGQLRDRTPNIPTFFLHNENQSTIKIQTYISGPDSGLGYTQDYRSRWTHENCVVLDSVSGQNSRRAASVQREVGQPAIGYLKKRVYTETIGGIPRRDRPPDVEQSERLMTDKRHDEGGTEGPCSPHIKLEMAVIQLQTDFDDTSS